jgi:hypothetical protein
MTIMRLIACIGYVAWVALCLKGLTLIRSRIRTQLSDAGVSSLMGRHGLPFDYLAVPIHRTLYPESFLRKVLGTFWTVHAFATLAIFVLILKPIYSAK